MQPAHLRPVPSRPHGPVEPAAAERHVAARLPELSQPEARALSLMALGGATRAAAAAETGASREELSASLAAARKALRRTLVRLGGSGWCERAERLISDRLDGDLGDRDAARLDVHLRNCPRCVEHERKLVQATDALVASFTGEGAVLDYPRMVGVKQDSSTPGPPHPAPTRPDARAPAESPPARAAGLGLAAAGAWRVLLVVAVILALASIGLSLAALLGAQI
jgi:Putative zinc-finger